MSAREVGFIGLGNIGRPMAARLVRPENSLVVYDAAPAARAHFEGKARIADSPAEVGAHADIIGVCVRDDSQLESVLAGEKGGSNPAGAGAKGLLSGVRRNAIVMVHSTVRPQTVKRFAAMAAERGAHLIDVAVTGGAYGAERGELCCMAGGAPELIDRVRDVISAFASRIIHAGSGVGGGMVLKAANNLVTMQELIAVHESMELVAHNGVDPALLSEVMTENGNLTITMRRFLEFRKNGPTQLGQVEFDRFQDAMGRLSRKDLEVALDTARDCGISLPGTLCSRDLIEDVFSPSNSPARSSSSSPPGKHRPS